MKKLTYLLLCFLLAQTANAQVDTTTCGCQDCPFVIPDNGTIEAEIPIAGAVINDLSDPLQGLCGVRLKFDHEYLGDLVIQLKSPAGQSVVLVGPTGFFGPTDNTTWDISFVRCDSVAQPDPGFGEYWNSNQPWGLFGEYSGSYYPSQGCLNDFNTGPVNGLWTLTVQDLQSIDAGNLYSAELHFCSRAGITCDPCNNFPASVFSVAPEGGWGVALIDSSTGVSNYLIDFGDGAIFSGYPAPTSHIYADTGSYVIRWIVANGCNTDTATQEVHIQGALPSADFVVSSSCAGFGPTFYITAEDHVQTWHWILPGGTPEESFDQYPVVTYAQTGSYDVLLIVTNSLGVDTIRHTSAVTITQLVQPVAQFEWVQIGNQVQLTNLSANAEHLLWVLPDGSTSSDSVVTFTVVPATDYVVTLFVFSSCGEDMVSQTIPIDAVPPYGNSVYYINGGCLPIQVDYFDISEYEPTSWQWYFEGGDPATATVPGPSVLYAEAGTHLTTLIVSNSAGSDTVFSLVNIVLPPPPEPIFFALVANGLIATTNLSQNAYGYTWLLNGVVVSDAGVEPVFALDSSGTYTVTLLAWNNCDTVAQTQTFDVVFTGTNELETSLFRTSIAPNPNSGSFLLEIQSKLAVSVISLEVYDATGRKIAAKESTIMPGKNEIPFELGSISPGLYALRLRTQYGEKTIRFIVQR